MDALAQRSLDQQLIEAARDSNAEKMASALAAGANPRAMSNGWTALLWAAYSGEPACIRALLPGSDVLWKDKEGFTPLLGAMERVEGYICGAKEVECVRLLLEAGSDLSVVYRSTTGAVRSVDDLAADICDEKGVAVRELLATERARRSAQSERVALSEAMERRASIEEALAPGAPSARSLRL